MDNYFNYFTEIEEHFQRRRGSGLLLSTLDWALIETWKDAGMPLEAVLRGIDAAFERWERRRTPKKVNSLAYCSQEVLAAAEEMKEAAVGAEAPARSHEAGFKTEEIAAYLKRNAETLAHAQLAGGAASAAWDIGAALRNLAAGLDERSALGLEDLEQRLTVLEEKLFAALLSGTSDEELLEIRRQAEREMAPYRRRMPAAQIDQLQKQYVQRRLLEKHGLPRLSLFYM